MPTALSFDFPTGSITPHADSVIPKGWLPCNGYLYDGTLEIYKPLWNLIGTTYGGTGQSSFAVPHLGGRTPVGVSSSPTSYSLNSFDTNTTGWTASTEANASSGSTITRDTNTFDTAPASGRWDNTGASNVLDIGDTLRLALSGTFTAGNSYTLEWRMRPSAFASTWINVGFGVCTYNSELNAPTLPNYATGSIGWSQNAFSTFSLTWIPNTTVSSGVNFVLNERSPFFGGSSYYWIDSVKLFTGLEGPIGSWTGSTTIKLNRWQTGVPNHAHGSTWDGTTGDRPHNHSNLSFPSHSHAIPRTIYSTLNKTGSGSQNVNSFAAGALSTSTTTDSSVVTMTGKTVTNVSVSNATGADASAAHSNIQPQLALNYLIKL